MTAKELMTPIMIKIRLKWVKRIPKHALCNIHIVAGCVKWSLHLGNCFRFECSTTPVLPSVRWLLLILVINLWTHRITTSLLAMHGEWLIPIVHSKIYWITKRRQAQGQFSHARANCRGSWLDNIGFESDWKFRIWTLYIRDDFLSRVQVVCVQGCCVTEYRVYIL